MAPLRHAAMSAQWSLSGGKRMSRGRPVSVDWTHCGLWPSHRSQLDLQEQALSDRSGCRDPLLNPKAVALGFRQIIIESLEILKAIERGGWKRPLGRFFSIIRGASDDDGANEVPRTRCRSASSRHWCMDCPLPGFDNLHSGRTARNSRDLR